MAASEHTPHYNLSQFGPDDRPSWLDDYNADMRTIDTALTQGGSQDGPLFCTAQVGYGSNFTAGTGTLYIAAFSAHEGNIAVDHDTHTITITKSGYYAISGHASVSGVTLDTGKDKSLAFGIGKYSEGNISEISATSYFNKSYEPIFNENNEPNEARDWGIKQSCSITPVIVHFNAGDAVTMVIYPTDSSGAVLHGIIDTMYLTVESKTFDSDAS